MGIKTEQVQISIDVKTQNAVREVAKLQHEYQDLIPQVDQARKAVDKASASLEKFKKTERNPSNVKWKEAYDNYYKQLRVYDELKDSAEKYNVKIESQIKKLGMAGLTNKELNRYYNDQKRALDGLRRGTDEYAEAVGRLKKAQEEKAIRRTDITGEKSMMDSLKGGLMPALIGGVAGGAVALAGDMLGRLTSSISSFVKAKGEAEKMWGVLAAELGLDLRKNAADIDFYKKSVSEMSKEFKMAQADIVDVIKSVGSLKPELLNQREALKSVTADVIILSKASNGLLTMEQSAEAVTGALNQFGEEANQSTRYINVMAAGAKEGSSKIQQTAEAFKTSGAVLSASGQSFEESNALVQVLATKMIRGSEAGTALRNIFSKLLSGSQELNPAIHGTAVVLERLSDKSPAEMMKLFGQESVTAAMELVKGRKRFEELTDKISGTTEAIIQYDKVTKNLSGDLDALSQSSSRFWSTLSSQSGGWIRSTVQGLTSIVDKMTEILKYNQLFGKGRVQQIADEVNAKKEADRKALNDSAREDVRLATVAILPSQKGKNVSERNLNANRKITEQVRGQFLDADRTWKDLAKTGGTKEQIDDAAKERQRFALKMQYAKQEGERLKRLAAENAETIRKIKEGDERLADKNGKDLSKKLHDELIANEARTLADVTKMRIEAISDENFKKESQLRQDFEDEKTAQLKLVSSKKLSQESYNNWLSYRKDTLNRELIKNDTDTEKKAREEAEKVNIAAAKRRIELKKESLQAKLALANATENKAAALDVKLMMLVSDKELELLTATEEEKLSIIAKYKIREQALLDEYDFDKAKSEKAKKDKEIDDQKERDKKIEDAKRALYQKIGSFISQTQNAIGEIFAFEKQGLENQLNQENARFDKKVKNLDKQKEKGIISEDEYQTAVDKLNAEHDAKEREIKKKMWEADKKARIANIIMSTAQGIAGALPNIPLSIISGIIGAIQLATAMNTEYPGYAIGDFTGKGNSQKYAGKKPTPTSELAWVNENGPEFILNNDGVNMPEFPIILPMLRKLNRRQSIFPDLRPILAPPKVGYAIGDFTGPAEFARRKARNTASTPQNNGDSNDRMVMAIEEFNKHCREGTWAKVMFSHKMADDFNELLIENEEVRSRASAK